MLKVIPVEEAVGLPLAHDITEIVPGKHKGPAFRRGHIVRQEDISKLFDVGKRNLYVMELEKDELHEEDAARRLAKAAAGANLKLTDPSEGRINLVAKISGLLKVDADLLYRFNSLGDLMLATLPGDRYVKEGHGGCRDADDSGGRERRVDSKSRSAVQRKTDRHHSADDGETKFIWSSPAAKFLPAGSRTASARWSARKVGELGSSVESVKLAPDDPDVIAGDINDAKKAGADIILVSGGMSVDPDDKTPEGIRRSGAKVETHGFPVLPGSMFVMAYLGDTPVMGLSGCVLHDPFTAFDALVAALACRRENHSRRHHGHGPWRLAAQTRSLKNN